VPAAAVKLYLQANFFVVGFSIEMRGQ